MLKKLVVSLLSVVMLLGFTAGTASAATLLNETIDPLVGTPYKWAGTDENGFDCSGFTMFLFAKFGIDLPHSSSAQNDKGYWIPKEDLRPGDLVFFNTSGRGVSHVGVYIGDGMFAHSANGSGITKTSLEEAYYKNRYVSARRILWDDLYNQLMAETAAE